MKKKILIVDDQFGIRALLSEVFQDEGFDTLQASNGNDALQLITAEQPDMILLDMKIPGMDGLEILRKIRGNRNEVNVIIMTAYGEASRMKEAKSLGVLAYIAKPFDIDFVRGRVKELMA